MFDYGALYEIQLQVSVDFLRVVQFVVSVKPGVFAKNNLIIL